MIKLTNQWTWDITYNIVDAIVWQTPYLVERRLKEITKLIIASSIEKAIEQFNLECPNQSISSVTRKDYLG